MKAVPPAGVVFAFALSALATPVNANVTQIETPLGCVNTVVTSASAPTGAAMADGGSMYFRDDIAPGHGINGHSITYLYVAPGDNPIANAGARVRVCLLSMPKKEPGKYGCNPAIDIRGRQFLVYDIATQNAAVYTNGEHLCGGA